MRLHQHHTAAGGRRQRDRSIDTPLDRVRSIPQGIHTMSDLRQFGGKAPPPFEIESDWAMGMRDGKPVDCALREGGMAWDRGAVPPRGDLRIPGLPPFPDVPEDASGRLQLAEWIASPENPLTARVAVNRTWKHLFGRGLVESVDNFGLTGLEPSHPALLDTLALRFMEDDWSVKRLIRSLMLSTLMFFVPLTLNQVPARGLFYFFYSSWLDLVFARI